MFGRNRSAVVEPLRSVSALNDIIADIEKRQDDLARLRSGLSAAAQEVEQLATEEKEKREAMYVHAARAHVNPEEQAIADRCHERAQACAERRADLQRQIAAFEQEIHRADKGIERLRNDRGLAKRNAWEDIRAQLLTQFGDDHRELLFKIWTAIDATHNGAPGLALLQHLGVSELSTETKLRMLDTLCETYGMPKH